MAAKVCDIEQDIKQLPLLQIIFNDFWSETQEYFHDYLKKSKNE